MAQRKQKTSQSKSSLPPQLATVNLHAAGIDVGAETQYVAVPPPDDPQPVRCFGACTADLEALADWLASCSITTVALESTGVYWIPLFELLETRGFEVLLVDPQQVHRLKGRPKSDMYDCQWLQRLHTFGLLAGAFRPADQVCVLCSYLRQRAMPLTYAGQHIQHRQKALTQMNIKPQHVVSEITGVTGHDQYNIHIIGMGFGRNIAPKDHQTCQFACGACKLIDTPEAGSDGLALRRAATKLCEDFVQRRRVYPFG